MFLKLNRFMTTEEVRREYAVPDALAGEILQSLPAVMSDTDGSRLHLESEVDDFLVEFARRKRLAEAQAAPATQGERGRKIETLDIALFADELRGLGKTWKEVWRECRDRWPNDGHVRTLEQVRATWRRHLKRVQDKTD